MLVNLSGVWVDPHKVVSLNKDPSDLKIRIVTTEGIVWVDGEIESFALIINNSLADQSFGGNNENETYSS